jgi:colicin import membrane protein
MSKAGRSGVELVDVEAAVAELAAENRRPTLRAVREHLGRGSLGTIQRHLADLQGRADSKMVAEGLPDSVTKAILAFALERFAGVEAQLAQKGADAEEAIRMLTEANDRVELALEAERETCARIQQESDMRGGRIVELDQRLSEARDQIRQETSARESADIRVARLEVQLERLPEIAAALDSLQARSSANEGAIAEARLALATATAELAASKQASEHYRGKADALQTDLSRTVAGMDELTRQLRSIEAENAKLTAVLERRLGDGGQHVPPAATPKKSRGLAGHGA